MKNLLKSSMAVALLALAITSCKKGDITSKRLDGTWKLSSGTVKEVNEYTQGTTLTTKTTDMVYDGATQKTTITYSPAPTSGNPVSTNTPYTEEYTFDRSNDSYTAKITYTSTDSYNSSFYNTSDCDFFNMATYAVTQTETSTTTVSGSYTILGATGDIEKNSRLTIEALKADEVTVTKWTYKTTTGADVTTTLYTNYGSGCQAANQTKTENTSSTISPGAMSSIWTVKSMSSSEMVLDVNESYKTTGGSSPGSNTSTGTKTYKQD